MNKGSQQPERPTGKRRKAKAPALRAMTTTSANVSDPTLYSNDTFRLPRLGADAPNNRHRASTGLSLTKATDLADAVEHATKIGLPFVKFVTIHFNVAGLTETARPQEATGKFLKMAQQWLRARGHKFAYVWVMERVTSIKDHVHIMCSCPHELTAEFDKKAKGVWLIKAGMRSTRKSKHGIKIERIGPRYHPSSYTWKDTHQRQVIGVLKYHLKGVDPDQAPANDRGESLVKSSSGIVLAIQPEHESTIFGRRCSRSENISAKARRTHWAMHQTKAA